MCRLFSFRSLLVASLAICYSVNSAFAAPTCNPNVTITNVSASAGRVYVTAKNNGTSTTTVQVVTVKRYSSTDRGSSSPAQAADSSGLQSLLSGQSTTISTSQGTCASVVVINVGGSCESDVQSFAGTNPADAACVAEGYYKKCNSCSVPTPTPTCTPTATPTATPTPQSPVCDAGGPYTGSTIVCSTTPVPVQLNGSRSSGTGLTYAWTSTCPGATFNNASIVNPVISLVTAPANASLPAVSCQINLKVSSSNGTSSTCSSALAAQPCVRDCAGTINGTAVVDRCGVCNGNGDSCVDCNSVNITGNQLALDTNANALRDIVLKVNRQLQIGSNNAGLSSTEVKANNQYIAKSNAKATNEYKDVWSATYTSFPQTILTCNSTFCVNVSTTPSKVTIQSGNATLVAQAKASDAKLSKILATAKKKKARNLKAVTAASKKSKVLVNQAIVLNNDSLAQLGQIPANQSSCN